MPTTSKRKERILFFDRPSKLSDNLVAFKGYDLLYGLTYSFESTTDPKVNFSIINKETKKVTTVSVPITKEVRGDDSHFITDVTFYRKGNTVYGGSDAWSMNRGLKAPTYFS